MNQRKFNDVTLITVMYKSNLIIYNFLNNYNYIKNILILDNSNNVKNILKIKKKI
jgi:hypothetical protein